MHGKEPNSLNNQKASGGSYPPAVVVGTSVNALSIIRSLGRKGIRVIALDAGTRDYGARSKYCEVHSCKNLSSPDLITALEDIGKDLIEKAVLFCTSDPSVLNVSKHRSPLEDYYNFVMPPHEVIEQLMSKRLFHEFAVANGFLVPKTIFTQSEDDVMKALDVITFPCIIKPEYRDESWNMAVSLKDKVLLAESKEEYLRHFEKYNIANRALIIQEWIDGGDEDVYFCLAYINRELEPLALFTGRKIRQYPFLTGSTSVAESIWVPEIAEASLRLLKAAACRGLCSVEFKRSRKDQGFYITEPTVGRSDTQEGISCSAGMDIPYAAYLDMINEKPVPLRNFREGLKWINEPLDFYSIRNYHERGQEALLTCLSAYRGKRAYALWALDDRSPFLSFVLSILRNGIRKIHKVRYPKNEMKSSS